MAGRRSGPGRLKVGVDAPESELTAAANRLRLVDDTLPGKLRSLLKKAARPITQEQKVAYRLYGDLGRTIARGIKLRVRTGGSRTSKGAGMRIVTNMASTGGKSGTRSMAWAPRAFDTHFNGWRAPTFGNRDEWHHHEMHGPSAFMGPAEHNEALVRKQMRDLLEASADEIRRATEVAKRT
jgi:hypothetical protein